MSYAANGFITAAALGLATGLVVWLIVRMSTYQLAPVRTHSNRDELRLWIAKHIPELDAELGSMSLNQVRIRLNEVTGCNVPHDISVESGCATFLAALQAQHERGGKD